FRPPHHVDFGVIGRKHLLRRRGDDARGQGQRLELRRHWKRTIKLSATYGCKTNSGEPLPTLCVVESPVPEASIETLALAACRLAPAPLIEMPPPSTDVLPCAISGA